MAKGREGLYKWIKNGVLNVLNRVLIGRLDFSLNPSKTVQESSKRENNGVFISLKKPILF